MSSRHERRHEANVTELGLRTHPFRVTMTRMSDHSSGDTVARMFREAREKKGWSIDEATFQARTQFPALKIGRGQVVRYEKPGGLTPKRWHLSTMVGLAALYDVDLSEVAPEIFDELDAQIATLTALSGRGSPWTPDFPPQNPLQLADAA